MTSLLLTGCGTYGEQRSKFILSKGWVGPQKQVSLRRLYCYKTLSDIECYDHEVEGMKHRLVNFNEPPICPPDPDKPAPESTPVNEEGTFVPEPIETFVPDSVEDPLPLRITPL